MADESVASPAAATPAAGAAATSGASATPTPGNNGAQPASPTGDGTASSAAANPNAENLRVMRERYEKWQSLGDHETVSTEVQGYRAMATKVSDLAKTLGYRLDGADGVSEAFKKDPYGTLQRLAGEAGKPRENTGPQLDPNVQKLITDSLKPLQDQLKPLNDHVIETQAQAAEARFDTAFNDAFSNHAEFKGAENIPPEIKSLIRNMAAEGLGADKEAAGRLMSGKTSDVKKFFDAAVEEFLGLANKYTQWKNGRTGVTAGTSKAPSSDFSLDDIINGTDKARAGIASMR